VLSTVQSVLSRGGEVTFTGFGKFHVAERGARQGKHPRTGEPIHIRASRVPRFSAGAKLKQAVNN
jgi:DNA-binding protein HU-beta